MNAIGGALSDSTVSGLYLHHTKVGLWFDGPMTNLRVTGNVIADQIADGLNFHTGVTDSLVADNFVRNTGDDGLAMWSERTGNARNTFDHNTVQSPVLANGIALYGGTDNTVSNNLVADPVREGSAIQVGSRFGAEPFTGHLWITDNTTVRSGTYELNWKIGLGALWFYALERDIAADTRVTGNTFLDNTYNALMLVADWPVKDRYSITNLHFKDLRIDGTGTSVLSARAAGFGDLRERGRPQRRRGRGEQLRHLPLHPGGLRVRPRRPGRQRRRRHHRRLAGALGAAQHDHLRRPPAGGRTSGAVHLVNG